MRRACRRLARQKPTPIEVRQTSVRSLPVIATVATDGGENRLLLDPIRIRILRVADNLGEIHFEEFFAQSQPPAEATKQLCQANPEFADFLNSLGLRPGDLAPRSDGERRQYLSMLRELLEWAALLKLAGGTTPRLLLRDGLLRSVAMKEGVFRRLQTKFEQLTRRHGHLLAGVAKRSRVANYLAVALGVNESFAGAAPGYLAIPPAVEREAAPAQYRWIGPRAMGRLFLARLARGENIPLLPVDLAAWQMERAPEVMAALYESARASFPRRGYPQALAVAHEHACLGHLEIAMLEHLLAEQMEIHSPAVAAQVRRLRLAGQAMVEDANDEQGRPA